jgi:hypothetical protein
MAYSLVAPFGNHLPYDRIEQIKARSGMHTPR